MDGSAWPLGRDRAWRASPGARTAFARAALALASIALLYGAARLAATAAIAVEHPFGLDYGEGTMWHQLREIVAGRGYAPLRDFPVIVFQYPPLYHLLTAGLAGIGGMDELRAGRLVSVAATAACALLTGLIAARAADNEGRRTRIGVALLAALLFATCPVTLGWSAMMRVDMLACALSMLGLRLAIDAPRRPPLAVWAGLAFAASLYTRQTNIAAPAAAFALLLAARPRTAWTLLWSTAAPGLALLAALSVATDGEFLRHVLLYNINRIVWAHTGQLAAVLATCAALVALGLLGAGRSWRRLAAGGRGACRARLAEEPAAAAQAAVLAMLALKTLMLPMILKSGASDNYLLDWLAPLAVLAALAAAPVIRTALDGREAGASTALIAMLGLGVTVQTVAIPWPSRAAITGDAAALARAAERVREADKPVVGDEMTVILRGGQPVRWEPAIAAELGAFGVNDERSFVGMIDRGELAFFVTRENSGTAVFHERYNPAVFAAMKARYPRREQIGPVTLHLPR